MCMYDVHQRFTTDLQKDAIEFHFVFGQAFAENNHFGQRVFQICFLTLQFGNCYFLCRSLRLQL